MSEQRNESSAVQDRRFTVKGDPSDVFALAEQQGWKITRPGWWQRTYAIPRWIVWLGFAPAFVRGIEVMVRSFS